MTTDIFVDRLRIWLPGFNISVTPPTSNRRCPSYRPSGKCHSNLRSTISTSRYILTQFYIIKDWFRQPYLTLKPISAYDKASLNKCYSLQQCSKVTQKIILLLLPRLILNNQLFLEQSKIWQLDYFGNFDV